MNRPLRNAFGRLLVSPDQLSREERLDEIARLAGSLMAGNPTDPKAMQWLGLCLLDCLEGKSLDERLGLKAPKGSHGTMANRQRQLKRDSLILRFANECGTDALAESVFQGKTKCPRHACYTYVLILGYGQPPRGKGIIYKIRQRQVARHST